MRRYWHLTSSEYQEGSDLLSFAARLDAGEVTAADWRWDHALVRPSGLLAEDAYLVSLWATASEALAWFAYLGDDASSYRVLAIDIDEAIVLVAPEGHPAVFNAIPADCISVLSLAELESAATVDEGGEEK